MKKETTIEDVKKFITKLFLKCSKKRQKRPKKSKNVKKLYIKPVSAF